MASSRAEDLFVHTAGSPEQRRHRKEPSFTRVFQQGLSRPKEGGQAETGHQPKTPQPIHTLPPLPNDIVERRVPVGPTQRLGSVPRPEGRLLSHPSAPQAQALPTVYLAGPGIPLQVSPVWPVFQPQDLHACDQTNSTLPTFPRHSCSFLPGRRTNTRQKQGYGWDQQATNRQAPPEFRVHPQHREVRPNPETMLHVFRFPMGHTGSVSQPPSGKERGNTNSGRVVVGPPLHHRQTPTDLRQRDFCIIRCASRPSAHEGTTDSSGECVQTPGRYGQTGSAPLGSQSQPGVLAVPATHASQASP